MEKSQIEDIIEDCVIIKMKDVPEHMVGIDLTWLDKEIRKIKDRLVFSLSGEEEQKDYGWMCDCGYWNRKEDKKCHKCDKIKRSSQNKQGEKPISNEIKHKRGFGRSYGY